MSDHHHQQRLVLEQHSQREDWCDAQLRAHVREALEERQRQSIRSAIVALIGR